MANYLRFQQLVPSIAIILAILQQASSQRRYKPLMTNQLYAQPEKPRIYGSYQQGYTPVLTDDLYDLTQNPNIYGGYQRRPIPQRTPLSDGFQTGDIYQRGLIPERELTDQIQPLQRQFDPIGRGLGATTDHFTLEERYDKDGNVIPRQPRTTADHFTLEKIYDAAGNPIRRMSRDTAFLNQLPVPVPLLKAVKAYPAGIRQYARSLYQILSGQTSGRYTQPTLLEVCQGIRKLWGSNSPNDYSFRLICDREISRKLQNDDDDDDDDDDDVAGRSFDTTGRSMFLSDGLTGRSMSLSDGLTGRSKFVFGGTSTNNGGMLWNPQLSFVQNLNMNKQGESVAGSVSSPNMGGGGGGPDFGGSGNKPNVGGGGNKPNVGGGGNVPNVGGGGNIPGGGGNIPGGGGNKPNIGGGGNIPNVGGGGNTPHTVNIVNNPKPGDDDGQDSDGDDSSPDDDDDDENKLKGRSSYVFGGSHLNSGGYSVNPQTSSVQNLNMNRGGQAVAGSRYSPNAGYY